MNAYQELLDEVEGDVGLYGKMFLPERFPTKFQPLHYRIMEKLNSASKKVAVAAPRGCGKTSLVLTYAAQAITLGKYQYIVYVSNTNTSAVIQSENLKMEMRGSTALREMFGDIKERDSDFDAEIFSKESWVAYGKTMVFPRGMGQQVRGILYKHYRPQLIIVDDLENREALANPDNRQAIKDWFYGDLIKCIDQYSDQWRIIYIDTVKHADSLMQNLLDDPDWDAVRLEACDDNFTPTCPTLMNREKLEREYEAHKRRGQLAVFYMEYRNLIIVPEDQTFRQEYFQNYDVITQTWDGCEHFVIVDPAKTVEATSADSAIVGVSVNYATHRIYVRDVVAGKMFPDQVYDEMFKMAERLGARTIGVEITGLNEFIKQPIMNEVSRRRLFGRVEVVWLEARGGTKEESGKHLRIKALSPYYRQGLVWHNPYTCKGLETQLLMFPRGALIDIADAVSYTVELLEKGSRYFEPPDSLYPNYDDDEKEYAKIDYDPPLVYDIWQRI